MHILTTNINGNPNVGLYGYATDKYCLLGQEATEKTADRISKVLGVEVHRLTICGTSLIGVFCAGNSNKLLVPGIVFDSEIEKLNKFGIDFEVIDTKLTALGNNILCNDNGALVNPDFPATVKKNIRQALGVSLKPGTIAEMEVVGSLGVTNSMGCLVHKDITRSELSFTKKLLGVNCTTGTLGMGSGFVSSGVICNNKGVVVSDGSWGPEIGNVDEALGFLKG